MSLPFQKSLCPSCQKMTLTKWPAVGEAGPREVCSNPGCGYKHVSR